MDHKNKFAAETVRQLQQSLDEVAPYQGDRVEQAADHSHAVAPDLRPPLEGLQLDGRRRDALGTRRARLGGGPANVLAAGSRRSRQRSAADRNEAFARRPQRSPVRRSSRPQSRPRRRRAARRRRQGKPPQPVGAAASAVAAQHATGSGTRREPEPRRSPVEVKPDTGDI